MVFPSTIGKQEPSVRLLILVPLRIRLFPLNEEPIIILFLFVSTDGRVERFSDFISECSFFLNVTQRDDGFREILLPVFVVGMGEFALEERDTLMVLQGECLVYSPLERHLQVSRMTYLFLALALLVGKLELLSLGLGFL